MFVLCGWNLWWSQTFVYGSRWTIVEYVKWDRSDEMGHFISGIKDGWTFRPMSYEFVMFLYAFCGYFVNVWCLSILSFDSYYGCYVWNLLTLLCFHEL